MTKVSENIQKLFLHTFKISSGYFRPEHSKLKIKKKSDLSDAPAKYVQIARVLD